VSNASIYDATDVREEPIPLLISDS
jgi:hypothetical protein